MAAIKQLGEKRYNTKKANELPLGAYFFYFGVTKHTVRQLVEGDAPRAGGGERRIIIEPETGEFRARLVYGDTDVIPALGTSDTWERAMERAEVKVPAPVPGLIFEYGSTNPRRYEVVEVDANVEANKAGVYCLYRDKGDIPRVCRFTNQEWIKPEEVEKYGFRVIYDPKAMFRITNITLAPALGTSGTLNIAQR